MFDRTIITSDDFLDMPATARCLYFTLNMYADDDGFVNNPKSIMRQTNSSADDMNILVLKKYVIPFETGVIVICHWRIHNYIKSDRYKETDCKAEKAQLQYGNNGEYIKKVEISTMSPKCLQNGDTELEIELGKDSEGKNIYTPSAERYGEFQNVILTDAEYEKLVERFPMDYQDRIESLSLYMKQKGKRYKSHYATILSWARKDEREKKKQSRPQGQSKGADELNSFYEMTKEWANE